MSFTRFLRPLLLCAFFCASFISHTYASGVKFTSPAPGATLPPGQFTVTWTDAGGLVGLSNLTTYNLALIVGGNTPSDSHVLISSLGPPDAPVNSLSLVTDISANIAQSIQNGFYLCMTSNTTSGNQVINYSNRFTLISLNGTTDSQYVAGAASTVGDSNVPSDQYNIIAPVAPSTTTSTTSTTTTSVSGGPSQSGAFNPDDHGDKTSTVGTGALIGLLIGTFSAVILLIILLVLGLFWWRRRRRARREKELEEAQDADADIWAGGGDGKTELPTERSSRLPAMRAVPLVELSPDQERFEAMTPVEAHEADSEIRYELEGDWAGWEAAAARQSKAYDPTL